MSRDQVHKYKPTNNLRHLLDDNVLDDATRKALMQDILTGPRPQLPPGSQHASAQTSTDGPSATASNAAPGTSRPRVGSLNTHQTRTQQSVGSAGARQAPPPTNSAPPTASASGTEDLLIVMTQRLRALESQTSVLQKELKEKRAKNIELQDALDAERTSKQTLQDIVASQAKELREVHRFLSDYGLSWVGGTASGSTTPRSISPSQQHEEGAAPPAAFNFYDGSFDPLAATAPPKPETKSTATADPPQQPKSEKVKPPPKIPFDLELLKRNAEILSNHVGNLQIANVTGGAMIKERDTVYVCVYLDGICVNSGLFRPYGWPLCEAVISDLLEGFYPYEFREKYPDGFPISIVDKSTEMGGNIQAGGNKSNVHNVDSLHDHGYKPLTKEAFLRKLPERYVTANGHLVNVRDGVQQVLVGGGTAAVEVKQDGTVAPATAASKEAHGPSGGANVTAVQIKMPQGLKVVLHMYFHNTVKELRDELHKAVPSFTSPFEFASMFPRRTYDDHSITLEEAQLVPNCTLMIKLLH